LNKEWKIPPKGDAAFVCQMEQILDVYQREYDPNKPVVCVDESNKQHLLEVVKSLPTREGNISKCDSEYVRGGVSNMFMFFEPLGGKRHVEITEQRTAVDFAEAMRTLVDKLYPTASKITVVLDNLNTHTKASLYKAFPPIEAKRIADRITLEYTPKHGSWLNMAESEFSVLSRQCLDRRIPNKETLIREIQAWEKERNEKTVITRWQFRIDHARIKLASLYPKIENYI
jgi:DDE superfamily endonuclease